MWVGASTANHDSRQNIVKSDPLMKWLRYSTVLLMITGCARSPAPSAAVAAFKNKHPGEFGNYVYLNPISGDSYAMGWNLAAGEFNATLKEIDQRCGTNAEMKTFVEKVLHEQAADTVNINRHFGDFKKAASDGGTICEYEWNDGKTRETGMLIIKSGEVIRRDPWITEYSSVEDLHSSNDAAVH